MLNPYYITGLIEGEGYLGISISQAHGRNLKVGVQVSLNFGISMNIRELGLIKEIKDYFDCGTLELQKNGIVSYRVRSFDDVRNKIVPFFDKYKFHGGKAEDLKILKIIIELMDKKEHLTVEGVEAIKQLRDKMHIYKYTY